MRDERRCSTSTAVLVVNVPSCTLHFPPYPFRLRPSTGLTGESWQTTTYYTRGNFINVRTSGTHERSFPSSGLDPISRILYFSIFCSELYSALAKAIPGIPERIFLLFVSPQHIPYAILVESCDKFILTFYLGLSLGGERDRF